MPFLSRLASLCALLWLMVSPAWGQQTLSFAVVPQPSATQLAQAWTPVLAWLSEPSGLQLRSVTAPDVPSFERRAAVIRYSGFWSKANYDDHLATLQSALQTAGIAWTGEPILSRYDPPYTPWFCAGTRFG